MSLLIKNGATSNLLRWKLLDSSQTNGAGLTGLTNASSGLNISTICDVEASATAYTSAGSTIQTIATLGTYAAPSASDCRFKEVDSTNHPGLYEFQFADARFGVSGAKKLIISVSGATNLVQSDFLVELVADDPQVAKPANFASLGISAGGHVSNVDTLTTYTGNTPQTGDAYARLGAPAGASTAADIAAVKSDIDAGVNVTEINGNANAAANVSKANQAIMRGTCSGGTTATAVCSSITTPASLTDAGQLIGRTIIFDSNTTTANLQGQASNITASTTGATPTLTFTAMTHAPTSGDTFSVV